MGIYKEKKKQERKQELDQESDHENKKTRPRKKKKNFLFLLITFLVEFLISCFLNFLFSFINSNLRLFCPICQLALARRPTLRGALYEGNFCILKWNQGFPNLFSQFICLFVRLLCPVLCGVAMSTLLSYTETYFLSLLVSLPPLKGQTDEKLNFEDEYIYPLGILALCSDF